MRTLWAKLQLTVLIWKGGKAMNQIFIDMYVSLIIAKRRKGTQVPAHFKDQVIADLGAIGLDENGDPVNEVK